MQSQFSELIAELTSQAAHAHRSAPGVPRGAPAAQFPAEAFIRRGPDVGLAKALTDAREMGAEQALAGFQIGQGVSPVGVAGRWKIIDLDAAAQRAKIRLIPDQSDCPAGVNFHAPEQWVPMARLSRVAEWDAPDSADRSFAATADLTSGLRAGDAAIEATRSKARALVRTKRRQLEAALAAGEIDGMTAVQSEIALNAFATRMGI